MLLPEDFRILGLLPDQSERLFVGLIVLAIFVVAVLLIYVSLKRKEKKREHQTVASERKMAAMRREALGVAETANRQVTVSVEREAREELKRNVLAMISRNPDKAAKVLQKMMHKKRQ